MTFSDGEGESLPTPHQYPQDGTDDHDGMQDLHDGRSQLPGEYVATSSKHTHNPKGNGKSKPSLSLISPLKKSASDTDTTSKFTSYGQKHSPVDSVPSDSANSLVIEEAEGQVGQKTNQVYADMPHAQDVSSVLGQPDEPIADFDWDDLVMRYHETVKELSDEEDEIMKEFAELSQFFAVWAQSGPKEEVESSYKRLKTQMKYVRREEQSLEEKRMHYVKVINAFQSALQLLGT